MALTKQSPKSAVKSAPDEAHEQQQQAQQQQQEPDKAKQVNYIKLSFMVDRESGKEEQGGQVVAGLANEKSDDEILNAAADLAAEKLAEANEQNHDEQIPDEPAESSPNEDEKQKSQQQQQQQQQQATREVGMVQKTIVHSLMLFIRTLIYLYDLISQPIFYFRYQVYKKQHEIDQVARSVQINPDNPSSPWRQVNIDSKQYEVSANIDSYETYDLMMKASFKKHANNPCYGYRSVLHEHWSKRPDSEKLFRQVQLSEYKWITFGQFDQQIEAARQGFLLEGIRAGDRVMLYADTRPEWQISSQALVRLGAVVVTMYSTLGVDGIVHSVNETQVTHVLAQKDKVSKLLKLKTKLPKLKKIIYFEPVLRIPSQLGGSGPTLSEQEQQQQHVAAPSTNPGGNQAGGDLTGGKVASAKLADIWLRDFEHREVECLSFGETLARGLAASEGNGESEELRKLELEAESKSSRKATKDSIAVIMYTSGSTGIPKGVLISHGNIMATINSFTYVTKDFVYNPEENTCAAYLPLAHIFEFCIESVMLYHGVRFGFATPQTLTDKSPGLQPGQVGDLSLLQPSVMIIVPLVLDRLVQGVKQALKAQSYFKEQLVSYLIQYKAYWQRRHYPTPLVDRIVCRKVATVLGGRTKYVICGSAPLSRETQIFVRSAFNLKLPQGFGTTETCAATACQLFDDQSTTNVGLPLYGTQVKLEPWIEGNYRPTDKPHPRGEVVVGGDTIAQGYFNLDEQTRESFYEDQNGTRWYRTGDIGEFLPNGNLKIIDRKKDLVKLQNGEYISLGKVESTLKSNPYTDNFCIYANSSHNFVVALGPANEASIKALAQQIVEEHERQSPSLAASKGERRSLLTSDEEAAIDEIKEVLASYESDEMNNNLNESDRNYVDNRKMSTLSASSNQSYGTNERLSKLCENKLIRERILNYVSDLARQRNLMSLEVPKKVMLLAEEWTEDKNLVTAAMKIRRNYIYKRYEQQLANLYAEPLGAC